MAEGTPSLTGDAFGAEFALEFDEDNQTPDDWSDATLDADEAPQQQPGGQPAPTPATQQEEVAPEQQPVAETGETPAEQPAPQGDTPPPGTTAEEARKWAGRFESPEKLEEGYQHLRRTYNRTLQDQQRLELQTQQALAQLERLKPYLPQLQALVTQQTPAGEEPLDLSTLEPEQLQALIAQQVQAGVQTESQRIRQEVAQEQVAGRIQTVVGQFMAEHPDIEPEGPLDEAIGELIEEFQTDKEGRRRVELFPYEPENLELAYTLAKEPAVRDLFLDLDLVPNNTALEYAREAASNPALATVLKANPHLVDSPEGMAYARGQAALPGLYQDAATRSAPLSPEQARRAAHVETGGTGAPITSAPATGREDEFDAVVDAYEGARDSNVFGLSPL